MANNNQLMVLRAKLNSKTNSRADTRPDAKSGPKSHSSKKPSLDGFTSQNKNAKTQNPENKTHIQNPNNHQTHKVHKIPIAEAEITIETPRNRDKNKKPLKDPDAPQTKPLKDPGNNDLKSKLKAIAFAALVAIGVGGAGLGIMWFANRKEVTYCTVQYESNGGSEVASEQIVCGARLKRPGDPTKDGFDFIDWVFEGLAFNFDRDTIDEDTILVAKWQVREGTETVTVKFDSKGGSKVTERTIQKGKTMTPPVAPTRSGYSFVGWYISDTKYDFSKTVDTDLTLTAKWTEVQKPSDKNDKKDDKKDDKKETEKKVSSLAVSDIDMEIDPTSDAKPSRELSVTITPASAKYELRIIRQQSVSSSEAASCSVPDIDKNKIVCVAEAAGKSTFLLTDAKSGQQTKFTVTVTSREIPVANLEIKVLEGNTTMKKGDMALKLEAVIAPENATYKDVTWSSSDSGVASVENGVVTAISEEGGSAVITAKAGDKTATINIVILKTEKPVTPDPEPDPEPEPEPEPGDDE